MLKIITVFFILFLFACQVSGGGRDPKSFSFVQMTDTQLGFGGYAHDLQTFEQAVKQINELKPDFVIICGDLVHVPHDSSYADFIRIREKFSMPCYCVPGNHDMGKLPDDKTSLVLYRKVIGKDYYSFRHKGYSFIITNTQLWKADVKNESARFDTWFMETLRKLAKKGHPLFVMGHIPLYVSDPEEKQEYFNFDPPKRKEVLDLFTENNVIAYLSGHTHKLVCNDYEGVQLVSCETTSNNFDKRPFGFRVWKVTSGSVSHCFIPLEL